MLHRQMQGVIAELAHAAGQAGDTAILDIPDHKSVKVLIEPSKVSKVIVGPYKGTVQAYVPPAVQATGKPKSQFDAGALITSPGPPSRNKSSR